MYEVRDKSFNVYWNHIGINASLKMIVKSAFNAGWAARKTAEILRLNRKEPENG